MIGKGIGLGLLLLGLGLNATPWVVAQPAQTPLETPSAVIAEADRLEKQVLELLQQGQYAAATSLAQQVLQLRRQNHGAEDPRVANALNNLAELYNAQGRYTEAEPLYKQALAIARKTLPKNHPQLAGHLNNLAALYHIQGRYTEAEPLYKQAIAIDRKALPENHPSLATSLNNLAELYNAQGHYSEAEPLYKQALAIARKALPKNHPQLSGHLNNLAALYYLQGRYTKAEPLYKQALAIAHKTLPENHPQLTEYLNNLAELYSSQGRYTEAEPLLKQTIDIARKTLPENHPQLATHLNNLARLYNFQGHYSKAEALFKQALDIARKALPKNHPQLATHLNNLARLYREQGHYSEAEPLLKQALAIDRKALPENHPQRATSLNNLAELYHEQGRYTEAEPLLKQVLAINHKALPENHPQLTWHLNNLAELYSSQGRYTEAEPLFKQAIDIVRKALPENHPQLTGHFNNLAKLYHLQGRYTKAEALYKQAIDIARNALPENHPQLATSLQNLAELYRSQGRYAEAQPTYQQAIAIARNALPENHLQLATSLQNLAVLYWTQNNVPQTLTTLEEGLNKQENNLATNLDFGSEAQKRNYLALFLGSVDMAISVQQQLAPQNPQAQKLALSTILRRKGRLLDVQGQTLNRLRQNASPTLRTQLEQLAQLKTSLSILANKGPQKSKPEDYLHRRQTLEQQITQLEAQLSRASAELKLQFNPVTIAQVQAKIPRDGVLIEFMLYQPFNPKATRQKQWQPKHYAVYLLTAQGQIQWADLGPANELEPIIQQFRNYVANPSPGITRVKTFAQKLYNKLLRPIQSHLGSAQHLLIAPDGPLNLIPFDALVDEQQQFLLENYQITYLSSGRDLLRLEGSIPKTQGPLLIANPDYNQQPINFLLKPAEGDSNIPLAKLQASPQRSREFRGGFFTPLPLTLEEGRALKKLLKNSRLLTGQNATETALKNSPTPNVLHIATHGIFLKDQPLPKASESDAVRQQFENPLLRSWLAFAGANHPQTSPDDGILTAFEVSGLDLRGTQLVTLSACQTGKGEVVNGEGVYGLRRAFTLAGARSQLMSLWDVQDVSTKDLMVAFYTRLQNGEGRGAALRAVQLQMLKGEIKDPEGNTYDHPYYWAGFVRTGDWTPIDLP